MYRLAGVSLLIGVAALLFYFLDPVSSSFPDCPVYAYLGVHCPGCGSQRAMHALVHGDLAAVFSLNPLMGLALVYFAVEIVIWILNKRGLEFRSLSARRWTPLIILVLVLAFWVLRNIPAYPFELLAPSV